MPTTITPAELDRALALRDLSDPDRGPHAMQLLVDAITEALERVWGCPVRTYRAGPVVTSRTTTAFSATRPTPPHGRRATPATSTARTCCGRT